MGSCGFQIPMMTSLPWLVLGWGQDPALRVFLDGLSGLSLLALWAVRSLRDTFQEPSGMGLGAEPAVDSCEEMAPPSAVQDLLLLLGTSPPLQHIFKVC